MERDIFENIMNTISKFHYSVEPFLKASKRIHVYDNFFELEDFYYHDWEKQDLDGANGLCQHLSCMTNKYLSSLVMGTKKFSDYYDIYYASGVYESRFFNWSYGNHICLLIFEKGDTEKGWIVDPSLKAFIRCFKGVNCYKDIVNYDNVFTTSSNHRYLISAKFGSSIRKELEVKRNTFTHYSSSFDSYLPLFIYENNSLVLAKFRRNKDKVGVEYYEHKENGDFSQKELISNYTTRYEELYNYSKVFSIIDSLLTKVSIIDSSQVDQHQRLISTELEDDYMMILYYIELAIVQAFEKNIDLTDRIVANVLNEIICLKEERPCWLEYLRTKEERIHRELLNRINSFKLESQCPKRILINALKQVMDSVMGFIERGTSSDAYLKFIVGYFK